MFQITDEQMIYLSRGDSCSFTLCILNGNKLFHEYYKVESGDKIYFAIMEPNQKFENAIVKKVFTYEDVDEDGNVEIKILPKDTEHLKEGTYYYTIKYTSDEDSEVETVVEKTKFFIV